MTERYSMNEFKPLSLMEKKLRIESQINDLENELAPIGFKVAEVCADLSILNTEIRGNRLPDEDYKLKQSQQNQLLREKIMLEKKIFEIKPLLRKLRLEESSIKVDLKRIPNDKAKQTVIEIRDKYMAFAADTTRVSSMRAMASRFIEEMQTILLNFN